MIPHPIAFFSFACGIPQGVLLGSIAARGLGLGGAWALLLIIPSGLLGIIIGYYQLALYHRLFGKR